MAAALVNATPLSEAAPEGQCNHSSCNAKIAGRKHVRVTTATKRGCKEGVAWVECRYLST